MTNIYDALGLPEPQLTEVVQAENEPTPEVAIHHQYAVNLADMLGVDFAVRVLLQPVMTTVVVSCERGEDGNLKIDGQAIRLNCDDQRFEAILSVIRLRLPKHKLRLYVSKNGSGWKRK